MTGFIQRLKERVFGGLKMDAPVSRKIPPESVPKSVLPVEANPRKEPGSHSPAPAKTNPPEREPYFVQIGFDFGTAFSKCVCRDVFIDKAWVHLPPSSEKGELPFLIASAISFDGGKLGHPGRSTGAYEAKGLYHVKMALESVALEKWQDPVLRAYREAVHGKSNEDLTRFVETCATYLIGGALGNVKQEVRERFSGRVDGDYLAVNMAVPVADADHPRVNVLFDRVLRNAWVLADELAGHPPMSCEEVEARIVANASLADSGEVRDACFIYPEVSANVQGFVRSRTSREGIYLFSDAGAGTVDQSVFLFGRPNGKDHLTYLHAGVFPLGSSHLEILAAAEEGDESWESLERWRQLKERGEDLGPLNSARRKIGNRLSNGTFQTISCSKQKLRRRQQMDKLRVIFGGGGHCECPYREAVIKQFDGNLFRADEIRKRRRDGESFDLGMPLPRDLNLDDNRRRWMDRLTVAYGLSFEQGQLSTFTLPKEVRIPSEEEIWRPIRPTLQAPSKDDV